MRIEELIHVSWNSPGTIRPIWENGQFPVLDIPAAMQKNDTSEIIPMLPGFQELLLETPNNQRMGWVFNPKSLQLRSGRKVSNKRPNAEWVSKVISRIGKEVKLLLSMLMRVREEIPNMHQLMISDSLVEND